MRNVSPRRLFRLARTIFVLSLIIAGAGVIGGWREKRAEIARPSGTPVPWPTARPTSTPPPPTPTAAVGGKGTFTVAPGRSAVSGPGPVRRFVVETEDGSGVDPGSFASFVGSVLFDDRSWRGVAFQRVDSGASFRITLATPPTTRRLCAPYDTGLSLSCYSGGRAVINLYSWTNGRAFFPDLQTYRAYLVNHEVGHALGHRHRTCPGAGETAPVMMQQSKGLNGCRANGWPLASEG